MSSFFGYSFLVYLAASLAAGADPEVVAGPEAATPPKLKKFDKFWPLIAFANILGQYD